LLLLPHLRLRRRPHLSHLLAPHLPPQLPALAPARFPAQSRRPPESLQAAGLMFPQMRPRKLHPQPRQRESPLSLEPRDSLAPLHQASFLARMRPAHRRNHLLPLSTPPLLQLLWPSLPFRLSI
ncbi:hypothetical protein H4R20_004876, partial [Coemansia guatemalensis]